MARRAGTSKTCSRCGRTGSHAFRRTQDGLFECTTITACRARAIRNSGPRHDGRGRLPRARGLIGAAPGVAYVIGENESDREGLAAALREMTDLAVVSGVPSKATLIALGSRNVKLIAASASCLESLAFRNEFALRCRQPKLSSVPVLLFGPAGTVSAAARSLPTAAALAYRPADGIGPGLRRQLEDVIGGEATEPELTAV